MADLIIGTTKRGFTALAKELIAKYGLCVDCGIRPTTEGFFLNTGAGIHKFILLRGLRINGCILLTYILELMFRFM